MPETKKEFTILIADDEKANLDILCGILSPKYDLLTSQNGPGTLELAAEHKPDLILLDVLMPDMTGFEVITKLKESEDTYKIPVILITGQRSAGDEDRGFFMGAADYITKPFHRSIVMARVNTQIKIVDQMRTIEQVGLIDALTKIPNRRGFDNRLIMEWNRAYREGMPISIMFMDMDMFRNYIDTYGYQQGEEAIRAFADISGNMLMRAVDIVARWGGEEFVMLLPGTDADGAMEVAERVRKSVEDTVIYTGDGAETRMTVSIGVNSVVPGEGITIDDFIKKADQALKKAKEAGKNRVVCAPRATQGA